MFSAYVLDSIKVLVTSSFICATERVDGFVNIRAAE